MWISKLVLSNYRSFLSQEFSFSKKINIIFGENNSGKSSILKAIYHFQNPNSINKYDVRVKEHEAVIKIFINENIRLNKPFDNMIVNTTLFASGGYKPVFVAQENPGASIGLNEFPKLEPDNYIYPFLSKRKVESFAENVNEGYADSVEPTLIHLTSKIDKLNNPALDEQREFVEKCNDILGFVPSSFMFESKGKNVGLSVNTRDKIILENMGDGVSQIIYLIACLIFAKNQIFIIEEIENDVHPKALKKLLRYIVDKSINNQIILTTHSNIVLNFLGAEEDTKIFQLNVTCSNKLPITSVEEIKTSEQRRVALEMLGYELYDYNIYNSWLIFEESSAETIIAKYLIPWFVRGLYNKTGHISANGLDKLEAKVEDFNRLFLYVHKQPIYSGKAWVLFDGGEYGNKLRQKFIESSYCKNSSWKEDNFICFKEDNFEKYYPVHWSGKVKTALELKGEDKKKAKEALLNEVINWIEENQDLAKSEFEKSAKEIIDILKSIDEKVNGKI